MFTLNHTPGPWKAEACPCGHSACRSWNVRPITYGQGIIGDEADARLMAAAPELLEALKAAVDSLQYVNDSLPLTSGYGVRHERIEKGLAAIAKAEGKSND